MAKRYSVETKRLDEQVRRNAARFTKDSMLQLSAEEPDALRSQSSTLKPGRGQHRKYLPYAFIEHGALMAANVLCYRCALEASVYVVRAFVGLRDVLAINAELAKTLVALEQKPSTHDQAITELINAIQQLTASPPTTKRGIGFVTDDD